MKKMLLITVIALPLLLFAKEGTKGYLGVATTELSEAMKIALDLDYGILVDKVYEDSPAEKTDIRTGDIILEIDGDKIIDYKTLKHTIAAKPNEKVKMRIYRSKKRITKDVELGTRARKKISLDMDIPDLEHLREDLKDIFTQQKKELNDQIEKLNEKMEKLKEELKELKKKIE